MITKEFKQRVVEGLKVRKDNYQSNAKFAVALGINGAQLSRVFSGDLDGVLSDANWIRLSRTVDVPMDNEIQWVTVETPVYEYIYSQLQQCQARHVSGIFCDMASIGKTYTGKIYASENKNAVIIDCSQVKTKQLFIRSIAREFGVSYTGRFHDVYTSLVCYIRSLPNALIILDEAGDLEYKAFLEIKALWNATEGACGWYMMGANGLRKELDHNREANKVGYDEIFSRFGTRCQSILPEGKEDRDEFLKTMVAMVAKANKAKDLKTIVLKTGGSLRRLYTELTKPTAI